MAIEEQLDLNTDLALEAIDKLEAALGDIGKTLEAGFLLALEAIQGVEVQIGAAVDVISSNVGEVVSQGLEESSSEPLGVTVEGESGDFSVVAGAADEQISGITPDINVQVDGDASGLAEETQGAIDAVEGGEVTVEVGTETDTSEAEERIRDLDGEEINLNANVQGSADVQALSESLDEVSSSSEGASKSAAELASELKAAFYAKQEAAEAAKKAAEGADEASAAFIVLAGSAKAVVGAFAAVAATATGFFASAVNAQGTLDAFNNTLGNTAGAVRNLEIGELSIDLAQLAQDLGSSDEAALQVGQQMGMLGMNVGATDAQISQLSSNIFGVAATLRASNPAYGELDAIARQLFQGMQRGGATLAKFGISLSQAEVKARAAQMTGRDATSTFNRFELSLAASSVAAEQLGDNMDKRIAKGLENPIIALSRFRQILGDSIEEMGKPLIAPFLEIIQQSIPVIERFLQVVADITLAAIPGMQRALEQIIPVALNFADSLSEAGQAAGDALSALADTFGTVIQAIGPLLTGILEFTSLVLSGAAGILQLVASIRVFLLVGGTIVAAFLAIQAAALAAGFGIQFFTKAIEALTMKTKIGLVVLAVTALVGIYKKLKGGQEEAVETFDELTQRVFEHATSVDGLAQALVLYNDELSRFIKNQEVLGNPELVSQLNEIGISVDDYTNSVRTNSGAVLENLAARALQADLPQNHWELERRTLETASKNWNQLNEYQKKTAIDFINQYVPGVNLVIQEHERLAASNRATTDSLVDQAVATGTITQEQYNQALAVNLLTGNERTREEVLQDLLVAEAQKQAAAEAAFLSTEKGAAAQEEYNKRLDIFSAAAALGLIGFEGLARGAEAFNMEASEFAEFMDQATEELNSFVEAVGSQVPSVVDAFENLNEVTSPQQIIDNFNEQIEQTRVWNETMTRLIGEGQLEAAALIAEKGPEATAELVRIYDGRLEDLNTFLELAGLAQATAQEQANLNALALWAARKGLDAEQLAALREQFGEEFRFEKIQEEEFDRLLEGLDVHNEEVERRFAEGGAGAVEAWGEEVASAVEGAQDAVSGSVKTVVEGAATAAEAAVPGAAGKLASKLAGELGSKVTSELGRVTTVFVAAMTDLGVTLAGAAGTAGIASGRNLISGLVAGMAGAQGDAVTMARSVMTGVGAASEETAKNAGAKTGKSFMDGVRDGLIERISSVLSAVRSLFGPVGQVAGLAGEAFGSGFSIGRSLSSGIEAGISAGGSQVSRVARDIVAQANEAAREEAKTRSPSLVWEDLGRNLSAGLAKGLKSSSDLPVGAASQLLNEVNAQGATGGTVVTVNVPVTVMGAANSSVGREIGQLASREIRSTLRLEGLVA